MLIINTHAFSQTTRYVTLTGKGDKTGSSWDNASDDLQMTINASSNGDQVFVAVGKYVPKYTPEDDQNFSATPADPRQKAFLMKNGVKLYGGFDPDNNIKLKTDTRIVPDKNGAPATGGTILSGDLNGDDGINASIVIGNQKTNIEDNAYHVVIFAGNNNDDNFSLELDGFTITGGNASGINYMTVNGIYIYESAGGGIYFSAEKDNDGLSALTLTNCIVNNNNSSLEYGDIYGGGIYCSSYNPFRLVLKNSSVSNNKLSSEFGIVSGGGISLYSDSFSVILDNSSVNKNTANGYDYAIGGGLDLRSTSTSTSTSTITLTKTNINDNNVYTSGYNARSIGGGIAALSYEPISMSLSNSNINNNSCSTLNFPSSYGLGGAVYLSSNGSTSTLNVANSSINDNDVSSLADGNIIYIQSSPSTSSIVNFVNSTLAGNKGKNYVYFEGSGSKTFTAYNSIVFGNVISPTNSGNATLVGAPTKDIQYSLVQGENSVTNGNLNGTSTNYTLDNLFTDATNGDYTLKSGSAAINKGDNQYVSQNKDLAGNARVRDNLVDMGAYEYQTGNTVFIAKPDVNGVLYVKKGATGIGESWDNPIGELADALVFAKTNNAVVTNPQVKEIWVAKGTYKPMYSPEDGANFGTDKGRDNAFLMVNNVKLYGGFDPDNNIKLLTDARIVPDKNGTPTGGGTILSGDLNGDDIYSTNITTGNTTSNNADNSYHVVLAAGNTAAIIVSLNGFTIKGANANSTNSININGNTVYKDSGGGIYAAASSSINLSNTSVNNNSTTFGGGIYVSSTSSSVSLSNSSINNNTAGFGGGIYATAHTTTTITSVILSNSTINNNTAITYGGGIYANSSTSYSVSLNNSSVNNNTASYGGGIYAISSSSAISSSVSLSNSSVNNNTAANGGGIYVYASSSSSIKLVNSTLASNKGNIYLYFDGSGSKTFTAYNSIIFGNVISATNSGNATLYGAPTQDIKNSLVQGESSTADGNLDGTSTSYTITNLFTDAANGDYTLKSGSAAINAGSNQLYTNNGGNIATDKDLAGNSRVFDNTIDMGAYENQTVQVLPVNFGEFSATKQANNVKLTWNTLSESNNKGFIVQKSTEGKTFTDLAFVDSKGTAANNYTLLDNNPSNGANYYRLIQQDIDGKATDLGFKVVNYVLANAELKAWPNPVSDVLNISFAVGKYQSLNVVDVNGKKLQSLNLAIGQSVAQITMGNYPKGNYFIELLGKNEKSVLKIIK